MAYQTQSLDTSIQVEQYLFNLWRSQNTLQRIIHLNQNTLSSRASAWYMTQKNLFNHSLTAQLHYFYQKLSSNQFADCPSIVEIIKMTGVIEETLIVAKILESLNIPYLVGGSVASSIWGELRYTQDIDLVADISINQVEQLISAFTPRFYISEVAIREAIAAGLSFNLIDNQTGWKIDIFLLTPDKFQQSRFQRQQRLTVDEIGNYLNFSTAEDTILQKLLWYRMAESPSGQQWRDILGILKLQNKLDWEYLRHWAKVLNIAAELEEAFGNCEPVERARNKSSENI